MKRLFIAILAIILLLGCENMSPVTITIDNPTERDYIINIEGERFVKSDNKVVREFVPTIHTDHIVDIEVILPNHLIKYKFDCELSIGRHYTISFDRESCSFDNHVYHPIEWYE